MFKSQFRGCPHADEEDPDIKPPKRVKYRASLHGYMFQWLGRSGFGFGFKELAEIALYPIIAEQNLGELLPSEWGVLTEKDVEPWVRQKGEYYYLVRRRG